MLILSENFDAILKALGEKGQSKLRAWLYRHNRISIIATAQAISPDLSREDRPFYGFFSPIYLKKLSYEDSLTLLTTLAETEKNQEMIEHLASKGRAQVRAIYELVKGNHRLLVTFYEFLKADSVADLSVIFMKTMNDLKPYYETFIRFLPAQQQKILYYLALAKIPQKGTDIAKNCFIATTSLTKQLSELQRQHLIDALVDLDDKRNKLYDVSEPLLRIAIEIGEQREGVAALFIDFLARCYSYDEIINQKMHFEDLYSSEAEPLKKQKFYYEIEARERALKVQVKSGILQKDESVEYEKRMQLGHDYIEQDKYDQAIVNYLQAVRIKPNDEWAWVYLGVAYERKNDYVKAIESSLKAIEIDRDFGLAWHHLGNIYLKKGNHTQAIETFQKSTQLMSDFEWTWVRLGNAYEHKGNYPEAINAYQQAIQVKLGFKWAWYYLGKIYALQNRYIQAVEAFQKVIDLNMKDDFVVNPLTRTITKILQSQTATESELTDLETWLQGRAGFEIISSYVTTYRRVVFGKEEKALYELPKEQRIFFEREILKRSAE